MPRKGCPSEDSLLVDIKTAAKLLYVCERTVRTLTKNGELPVVRIMGCVLYSREDLAEFVRQRSHKESSGENEMSAADHSEIT